MHAWASEVAAGAAAFGRLGLLSSTLSSYKERRASRVARKAADEELVQVFDPLAVRAEAGDFLQLADRLANIERPVASRGVLLTRRLLDDVYSPLYDRDREDELADALDSAAEALEPR